MKVSKKNISLPEKLADYVADMSGEDSGELRVLVYVLSGGDGMDTAEIAERLGMAEQDVVSAVSFWRGMGLLTSGTRAAAQKNVQNAKNDESAEKQAKESLEKEILTLICHGILHLFGFDHLTKKDYDFVVGIQNQVVDKL